jgi:hypothetical protein
MDADNQACNTLPHRTALAGVEMPMKGIAIRTIEEVGSPPLRVEFGQTTFMTKQLTFRRD